MRRIVQHQGESGEDIGDADGKNEINKNRDRQDHAAEEEPQQPVQQLAPFEDERNADEHYVHYGELCQHERLAQHEPREEQPREGIVGILCGGRKIDGA